MGQEQTETQTPGSSEPETPQHRMSAEYSVANAEKFGWGSISGELNPERRAHLETHLIGPRVLDAGCGGGGFVDFLSETGFEAVGVDLHAQFLEVARRSEFRGRFVQGDVSRLPFRDKVFDSTFCFDVLEHIDDDAAALREFARVTKRRILFAVPRENEELIGSNLTFLHYQDKTHVRNYTVESIQALAAPLRPSNVQVFPELFVPARDLVLSRLLVERWEERISAAINETVAATSLPEWAHPPVTEPHVELPFGGPLRKHRMRFGRVEAVQALVTDAYVAQREQMREQYERTLRENAEALRAAIFEPVYEAVVQQMLDDSMYRSIATGLVAVVDL